MARAAKAYAAGVAAGSIVFGASAILNNAVLQAAAAAAAGLVVGLITYFIPNAGA